MLRCFKTKDSKGCEFEVFASYYTKETMNDFGSEIIREKISEYSAFDYETTNLNDLKKLVGDMG